MSEELVTSTGQRLMQKVVDSIIPIILSTVVSLFANKTFVQRSQKKRLHSKTINDESFKPWNNRINELCLIGLHTPVIEYSHEEKKIIPVELKSLDLIPHHTYLESHMKTGYPQIWEAWEQLRLKSQDYFQSLADVHEAIRSKIVEESQHLGLVEHYYRMGRKTPQEFIKPDKLAAQIYNEINNRLSGMDEWMRKPTINFSTIGGGVKIHHLNLNEHSDYIYSKDINHVIFINKLTLRHADNSDYIKEIKKIRKMFDEIIEQRDKLEVNLEEIMSKIDLVNDVKGKCEAC